MCDPTAAPTGKGGALGIAGSRAFVTAVGAVVVSAGGGLGVLRLIGDAPELRGVEAASGAFALGAVMAAPGLLALLSLADRPALLLPAGVLLVPLSFVSFAGVTLPLLVPAVMLLVAYGRRCSGHTYPGQAGVCVVVVVVLVLAAFLALFANDDPRRYSTPTGGGSTSDVITVAESLGSLALTAAALGAGWFLARR